MPVRKEIVWSEVEESNLLILKENETIRVEFMDNGYVEPLELESGSVVNKYIFNVKDLDDNKSEKEFSTIGSSSSTGNRLTIKLKAFNPIKGKHFSIRKFSFGKDEFDIDYEVNLIGK